MNVQQPKSPNAMGSRLRAEYQKAKRDRYLALTWQKALEKLFDIEERFKRQGGSSHKVLALVDESITAIIGALRESMPLLSSDLEALKSCNKDEIKSIIAFWPTPLAILSTEIRRVRRRQTSQLFAQNDVVFVRGRHIEPFVAAALSALNRLGVSQMEAAENLQELLAQNGFHYEPETLIRWLKHYRRMKRRGDDFFNRYCSYFQDVSSPPVGNRKGAILRRFDIALKSIFTKESR